MKKARAFLDTRGVDYAFHDYKVAGIERGRLEGWAKKVGWESVLNKAGTTFRKLPDKDKEGLTEAREIKLMLAQPSVIKGPHQKTRERRETEAAKIPQRKLTQVEIDAGKWPAAPAWMAA